MIYNIKEFGATGRGVINDTEAIQKAVDAAYNANGGTVLFPNGVYLTGTVLLKSNITLQFENNAVLYASNNFDDYLFPVHITDSRYRDSEGKSNSFMSLLYAYNEKNIKICGGHLISDEEKFWLKTGDKESFESALTCMPWHFYRCTPEMNRPRMLLFEDCKNIKIQDLLIEKSPVYSGWFLGCENVYISGIYIKNNYAGPNADGLHFSSCKDVRITDSVFICGDDCIAIDPNHRDDSEAFTISGCIFDTSVHAFRIYTGLDYSIMYNCGGSRAVGMVRNIAISNCIIKNAAGIFDINAENGSLENINISNITASLEWEGTSFVLSTNNGKIKNIIMNGMTIKGNGCGVIWGDKPDSIEDILIDNTIMEITPKTKVNASYVPDFPNWCHLRPNNFKIKYSKNVIFSNLKVKWNEPVYSDKWNENRRSKIIERIGIKTLETMEPKCFKAFDIEECKDISFNNVLADDFNINF